MLSCHSITKTLLIITAIFLLPMVLCGQASPENAVSLNVSVLKKHFRKGDVDLQAIDLLLNLTVTNQTKKPILLYKGAFDTYHIWASENVEKLRNRQYEQSSALTIVAIYPKPQDLSLKDFILLEAGKSVSVQSRLSLFTPYDQSTNIVGALKRGKHVMSILTYSWPWLHKETDEITSRFRSKGEVWTDSLKAQPFEIDL